MNKLETTDHFKLDPNPNPPTKLVSFPINNNDTAMTTTKIQSSAEANVLSLNLQKWQTETKSCWRLSADVRRRHQTSVPLWHCVVWWELQDVMKPEKTRLTHCLSGTGTIKKSHIKARFILIKTDHNQTHRRSSHKYSIAVAILFIVTFVARGRCSFTIAFSTASTVHYYWHKAVLRPPAPLVSMRWGVTATFLLNRHGYTNHDDDIFEWRPSAAWSELLFCSNSWSGLTGHTAVLCDFNLCFSSSCHPFCSSTVTDKLPIMFHKRRKISFKEVTII